MEIFPTFIARPSYHARFSARGSSVHVMHELLPFMCSHNGLSFVSAFVSSKPICKHCTSLLAIMVVVVECVL